MKNQKALFEFLGQLIDIQIKKYRSLLTDEVVQDARLNARLVFDEVNELLGFAEQLVTDMENPSEDASNDPQHFRSLFNQIKFYLEQEHSRAYAAWLLDEQNSTKEAEKQLTQLLQIGESAKIDSSSASMPVTHIQKQCEFDSAQIAFQIVNFVKEITKNPEIELDSSIPIATQKGLRRNAKKRYCQEEFMQSIDNLYKIYTDFFEASNLENVSSVLSKDEINLYTAQHRGQWESLQIRYQTITAAVEPSTHEQDLPPHSSTSNEEHQISIPPAKEKNQSITPTPSKKPESSNLLRNSLFYGGLATLGAVAVCMLLSYFTKNSKDTFSSLFKPS